MYWIVTYYPSWSIFFNYYYYYKFNCYTVYTNSIKDVYTVIQLNIYIYKIFKITGDWIKHFYWYDNIWFNVYIKKIYIDSIFKLNLYIYICVCVCVCVKYNIKQMN